MSETAIGWDLHRKFSQVSVLRREKDGELRVIERARLEHADRDGMRRWMARQPTGTPAAMEGAFGWQWVADLLTESGLEPHLGHPPAIKALAKGEPKTDRRDADRLARFWLQDKFPQAYLAPPEVRLIRERIRYRAALVELRSGVKNRIQALLHRRGLLHGYADLFGKAGRRWLAELELTAAHRTVLDGWLQVIDELSGRLKDVETWMTENLEQDMVVRLLRTIPGIGLILAHVIRSEIGEIARFDGRGRLVAYAGLAPLSDDSAERRGRRHISPFCNHTLRWAFIEAAGGVLRSKDCPERLRRLHQRLTLGGRTNKAAAKVAVARELCQLVYVIWKKGTRYTENPPPRPGAAGNSRVSSLRSEQPRYPMVRRRESRAARPLSN
jgi:transposase